MAVVDDRLAELNPKTKTCMWIVRVADSAHFLQLDPSECDSVLSDAMSTSRTSYHHVDVRDKSLVFKAVEGSFVVFYMDDTDLQTDDFYLCHMIIVQGAKNVINACRECKVRRLINNCSANVDELLKYPSKFENVSSELKAQAEALILRANDIDGLLTSSIRPCDVFEPRDTQLVPFLVNLANSGWAKFIIGNGENMSDFTYAENVSHAHVCAEEALDFWMASVAGKELSLSFDFEDIIILGTLFLRYFDIVAYFDCKPSIKLPSRMVLYVILFFKLMHEKLGFINTTASPPLHYFYLASHSRTFNCTAAHKHIGYSPVVSLQVSYFYVQIFSEYAYSNSVESLIFLVHCLLSKPFLVWIFKVIILGYLQNIYRLKYKGKIILVDFGSTRN
ncbi:hypothetical protein FNV43_RR02375 [Rhamnella rubrinervis]|uniref:3-beta hydroxysteroid dehydrogenase/isomerase domain-containing protein n=1 Tax=Rhamnella rubrinervis TaxID=2594499 RepID=A0A8K0MT65_9ROSA|nr:hypothetical protein FNV43_RR02375 [Rhamnella rubrinervis]